MKRRNKMISYLVLSSLYSTLLMGQTDTTFQSISLNDLSAFSNPGPNWIIASGATVDYTTRGDMTPIAGQGIVVNSFSEKGRTHLFTKKEFGDLEIELDFMMANYSNSGVYLQGRYEIQLLDSWTRLPATSSDCGGIYVRWKPGRGTFEGTPPVMNVAKAPGLWQHLYIRFKAPRFNSEGKKTANARFEEVYLNGVLVQQQAEVTGPTGSAMFPDESNEKPSGPLVLQGDHGKVAFRNIRYRSLQPLPPTPAGDLYWLPNSLFWQRSNPIVIKPSGEPYLIRTFINHQDQKLTHAVSVGYPNEVNYGYDLKRGAIFEVWRGQFLDVTPAWKDRGGMQLGIPLGSVISLSDAPVLSVLENDNDLWPDSLSFDDLQHHGYRLNKTGSPTFSYALRGMEVVDSVDGSAQATGITRTITVPLPPDRLFCRIAADKNIEKIGEDLYAIGDRSYYVRIDKKYNAVIRQIQSERELIVRYNNGTPVNYSLIW